MNDTIYLKQSHASSLRHCVRQRILLPGPDETSIRELTREIDRALIVDDRLFPDDAVGLHSKVEFEYCDDGLKAHYRLVLPHEVNGNPENVSVLTPLGLALLGARVGQVVHWPLVEGRGTLDIRIIKILTDSDQ